VRRRFCQRAIYRGKQAVKCSRGGDEIAGPDDPLGGDLKAVDNSHLLAIHSKDHRLAFRRHDLHAGHADAESCADRGR
jgi:hypothetical protein